MSLACSEGVGWEKDACDAFQVPGSSLPWRTTSVMRYHHAQTEGGPVLAHSILYPTPHNTDARNVRATHRASCVQILLILQGLTPPHCGDADELINRLLIVLAFCNVWFSVVQCKNQLSWLWIFTFFPDGALPPVHVGGPAILLSYDRWQISGIIRVYH